MTIDSDSINPFEGIDVVEGDPQNVGSVPGVHEIDVTRQVGVVVADVVATLGAANDPARPRYVVLGGLLSELNARSEAAALTADALAQDLGVHARAFKVTRQGKPDTKWPPEVLAGAVRPRLGALATLAPGRPMPAAVDRIARAPYVNAAGAVVTDPGMRDGTLLVPDPSVAAVTVPEFATPADAIAAATTAAEWLHDEVLCEFPFATPADRANLYAYLLAPIIRELIELVPLFLLNATAPGSGKGLLSDVVTAIAQGDAAITSLMLTDEKETRLAITSAFTAGATIGRFDEVTTLHGRALQKMLTDRVWSDRPLGVTAIGSWVNRVTWAATGNGVQIAGDMPRRVCQVRLTPVGDPSTKKYAKADLVGWVSEHRAECLGALLTMVAAWVHLGRPEAPEPVTMGSFQSWATVTAGILAVSGVPGFMTNRAAVLASSPDEHELVMIVAQIADHFADAPFTSADLYYRAEGCREDNERPTLDMPGYVASKSGEPARRRAWGSWLAMHVERWVDGRQVARCTDPSQDHHHRPYWRIVDSGQA